MRYNNNSDQVVEALGDTRIGHLKPEDNMPVDNIVDHYVDDPYRDTTVHRELVDQPFCSETYPHHLNKYLVGKNDLYVRNHGPVPNGLQSGSHLITFSSSLGSNDKETSLSVTSLVSDSRFTGHSVTSVLQCAGNRASEDILATGTSGFTDTPFERIKIGMMGNIQWSGIRLSTVLKTLYPIECADELTSKSDKLHVKLTGADQYETSVPLSYILDNNNECILATQMNGDPLTPDHGAPVRVVLPGLAGARCVKWCTGIELSLQPSDSPWNAHYYRHADASHIQLLPMQSLLLSPTEGDTVNITRGISTTANAASKEVECKDNIDQLCGKSVHVEGIAYSGGSGAFIDRVEVSIDGGVTWITAKLLTDDIAKHNDNSKCDVSDSKLKKKSFGWVRFMADVDIGGLLRQGHEGEADTGVPLTLCCRATDAEGVCQPKVSLKDRGYLYNGWHNVKCVAR